MGPSSCLIIFIFFAERLWTDLLEDSQLCLNTPRIFKMLHLAGGAVADDERTDVLWGRSLLRPVRRLPGHPAQATTVETKNYSWSIKPFCSCVFPWKFGDSCSMFISYRYLRTGTVPVPRVLLKTGLCWSSRENNLWKRRSCITGNNCFSDFSALFH